MAFDVFADYIAFEIYGVAGLAVADAIIDQPDIAHEAGIRILARGAYSLSQAGTEETR